MENKTLFFGRFSLYKKQCVDLVISGLLFPPRAHVGGWYSNKSRDVLESTLNNELIKVNDWLIVNKLSLNVSKSNVLAFRAKNANDLPLLNLTINGQKIEEKTSAKYLGILFDNKLTWKPQIEQISKKIIKNNALLAKLRHFIPSDKLKTIYNALIQPHIDYVVFSHGGLLLRQT